MPVTELLEHLTRQREAEVEALLKAERGEGEAPIIYKGMPIEVKDVDGDRMVVVGSDETEDRDGDILRVSGWELDNYRRNPVGLWAHSYREPPIFRSLEVGVEGTRLRHVIEWAHYEFAQLIKGLYVDGFMRAFSVGFLPKEWKARWQVVNEETQERRFLGFEFTRQELLELSSVPVPANPNALRLAVKAMEEGITEPPAWLKLFIDTVKALADRVDALKQLEEEMRSGTLLLAAEPADFPAALPEETRSLLIREVAQLILPEVQETVRASLVVPAPAPAPEPEIAPDDAAKLLNVLQGLRQTLPQ